MTHVTARGSLVSAGAVLLLALGGCAAGPDERAGTEGEPASDAGHEEHVTHEGHGAEEEASGTESGHDHSTHDHGHRSAPELAAMLVAARDLPDGYRAGHAHHTDVPASAPRTSEACAPLAELIGEHPDVRQTEHPEARTVFSKSHFGPLLGETIVDFGTQEAAAAAVERLDSAAADCGTYQQSTSSIGAQRYRTTEGPDLADRPGGSSVRLVALGDDFDISWDVWWVQYGAQVVAVDLRSAPGGEDVDLAPAVDAAIGRVEAADG